MTEIPKVGDMVWTCLHNLDNEDRDLKSPCKPHKVEVVGVGSWGSKHVQARSGNGDYSGWWIDDFRETEEETLGIYIEKLRCYIDHLDSERTTSQIFLLDAMNRFRQANSDEAETFFDIAL